LKFFSAERAVVLLAADVHADRGGTTTTAIMRTSAHMCGDLAELRSFIRSAEGMAAIIDGREDGRRCIRKGRVMN
jgi:hypothetical protein